MKRLKNNFSHLQATRLQLYKHCQGLTALTISDVCGMRHVGEQRRKGSEWWNEEVGSPVAEKRRAFVKWLQRRDRVTLYTLGLPMTDIGHREWL